MRTHAFVASLVLIAIGHTWSQAHSPSWVVAITRSLTPRCAGGTSARRRTLGLGYIEEETVVGRWMPIVGYIVCIVVIRGSARGECLGRVCSAALPAVMVADA